MDLATRGLALHDLGQKIDKLRAGVAGTGFRQHLSGLSVQSAVERKGSMAVVLEAMPLSAAWRKRQHRVQAIQRLDGAFLVYAEDSGVRRWVEIQADDVGGFLFELRIITGHITARPVRLEPKLPPHSTDC